jgi:hypothetical protein
LRPHLALLTACYARQRMPAPADSVYGSAA